MITDSTNYLDSNGSTSSTYYVTTVLNGKETEQSDSVKVLTEQYKQIDLQKPASGTTPSGETYTPNDCSVGDLDAYKMDGTKDGAALWDAKTGEILFRCNASSDTGRCIAGNFVAGNSTAELASYADSVLYDAKGNKVGKWSDITKWGMNYAVYWDADLEQEALDRTYVDDYDNGRLLTVSGVTSNNSTKANTSLTADILGDWREEIIWSTTDGNALRIYSTTDVTSYRIYTLMHNTQYRCQVAAQNVAYNQGAYTDYFLESGYDLPSLPNVYAAGSGSSSGSSSGSTSDTSTSSGYETVTLSDGWYCDKTNEWCKRS